MSVKLYVGINQPFHGNVIVVQVSEELILLYTIQSRYEYEITPTSMSIFEEILIRCLIYNKCYFPPFHIKTVGSI